MSQRNHGCREFRELNRLSRRGMLGVGALAGLGLTLPDVLRRQAMAATAGETRDRVAKAKSVIVLWLQGGVTHHETFDPKPNAPVEVRGEFSPIPTNVPGIHISELMPESARCMDRLAVIRSVTHSEGAHERGMRYMLACRQPQGRGVPDVVHPDIGAIVAHELGMKRGLPPYVEVPGNDFTAGRRLYGPGYLPAEAAPFYGKDADVLRPGKVSLDRFQHRRGLQRQLETAQTPPTEQQYATWDRFSEQAADIIVQAAAGKAFDISEESLETYRLYGVDPDNARHNRRMGLPELTLQARRLVEAGVRFVTVGRNSWDHHSNIFPQVKTRIPRFDRAFTGLIEDLRQRGMLDETLVIYLTEFGRTPKINSQAGRDHWANVFSVAFAGAGIAAGQVIGASDDIGGYPADRPVSPEEIGATILHLTGIDPQGEFIRRDGRPIRYVDAAQPIPELLA